MSKLLVGLIGQPNVGKSTLFNVLTKGNVIVSNWPGTTVERVESTIKYKEYEIKIVDLPGIYGLSYFTLEEKISRNFIVEENPDLLVVLVDSLALERTFYLAVEVLELTSKALIAITKVDIAHSKGIHVNYDLIEKRLGVPVVPVSAIKGSGVEELLDKIIEKTRIQGRLLRIDYGELEPFITGIEDVLRVDRELVSKYPARWLALKFLEGDEEVEKLVKEKLSDKYRELVEIREEARRRIGRDLAAYISMRKMHFIRDNLLKNAVVYARLERARSPRIFYNPYIAPLLSTSIIFALFLLVFIVNTGYPLTTILEHLGYTELAVLLEEYSLSSLIEKLFDALNNYIIGVLGETPFSSFITDGIIAGVVSVVVFIPLIAIVMLALGALEDSGLLPRLAIGAHILLSKFGLSGHAILPLTLSLGCNVPGVMSTRAIPNHFERLRLILLTPFIPCQARLLVLLVLSASLGGVIGALLVPLVYLASFLVVLLLNYVLYLFEKRKQHEEVELLLEIPPLHRPYFKVVWWFTWHHLKHFLVKAGTVIFLVSIISWGLQHTTPTFAYTENPGESIAAFISRGLEVLLKPLGVSGENTWIVGYALLLGFLAKELILGAIVASTGVNDPLDAYRSLGLSIPTSVSLALFIALYVPCLATIAIIYSETKNWKTTISTIVLMMTTAYLLALLAYNITMLIPL